MRWIPYISLALALFFLVLAWRKRREFSVRPYYHWFIYLHLAAVGLHQFEEYGWPGGFRDVFARIFVNLQVALLVPSTLNLELLNTFGFTLIFGLIGWLGTRMIWLGMALLYLNFSNGFFHLVYTVTQMTYIPGTITGTLLYLPLALLATRFAILRHDVGTFRLLLAFGLGTGASFLPFVHVWLSYLFRLSQATPGQTLSF